MLPFSKDPKLSFQKLLVFGAVGYYIYTHIRLKRQGALSGEPDLLVSIDKKKMFDLAEKRFSLNPLHRSMLEGVYDTIFLKGEDDGQIS